MDADMVPAPSALTTPRRPRCILMTADALGGVWNYALELTRGLGRLGIEVVLATMGVPLSNDQRQEALRLRNLSLQESTFKLEWMDDPWDDVELAGAWLLSLEEEHRPDLVHLNGYVHASLPWKAPCLVVGHSCVLSWWEAVRGGDAPSTFSRYRERVARGLAAADLVAAPSATMRANMEQWYLPLPGARVIHNAASRRRFRPARKEGFILSVGRVWDEGKNISSLAAVAPNLRWPVYVAGEELHPEGGTSILEGVHPLGILPPRQLARWFGAASIYALPARYEPFGLTVLEAAMSGCALVLGDIPSLRELWEDAALFVDPSDTKGLARALTFLSQDPGEREVMSQKALARSRSFSPSKMAAEYLSAYLSLGLESPAASGPYPVEGAGYLMG